MRFQVKGIGFQKLTCGCSLFFTCFKATESNCIFCLLRQQFRVSHLVMQASILKMTNPNLNLEIIKPLLSKLPSCPQQPCWQIHLWFACSCGCLQIRSGLARMFTWLQLLCSPHPTPSNWLQPRPGRIGCPAARLTYESHAAVQASKKGTCKNKNSKIQQFTMATDAGTATDRH